MAGRAVALLPCASGPSSWWRRIGYRWLTPSCCGVWSPAGGLFPGRPGAVPLGPVSRIIPLTEVSGMNKDQGSHVESARIRPLFGVSGRLHRSPAPPLLLRSPPACARLPTRTRSGAPHFGGRGSRRPTVCQGVENGQRRQRDGRRRSIAVAVGVAPRRIGRGSRRAWARCQDVGRIGGGRPGRARGRRGGWVAGGDLGLRARGARGCPSFTPALDLPLWLRGGPPWGVGEGLRWNGTPEQKETRGPESGTSS